MNTDQMTPVVRRWLRHTEATPPDARQSAHQVMARMPRVRQRSRWWPLPIFGRTAIHPTSASDAYDQPASIPATNGHTATITGRTQIMFSSVKAVTAGALIFAIGGAFLIGQQIDPQGSGVPGATSDEGIGEMTRFEGKMNYGNDSVRGIREALPNGDVQSRGQAWALLGVEMSDPRLQGDVTSMWNWDDRLTAERVEVAIGGFRIENDDGAWQMQPIVNFTLPDGTYTTWTATFDGEGDYEGLTAIAEVVEGATGYSLRGVVIDGDVPPLPESMPTD